LANGSWSNVRRLLITGIDVTLIVAGAGFALIAGGLIPLIVTGIVVRVVIRVRPILGMYICGDHQT